MKSPEGRGGSGITDDSLSLHLGTGSLGPQDHLKATMVPPHWEEPKPPLLVFRNPLLLMKLRHSHSHNGFVLGVLFSNNEISWGGAQLSTMQAVLLSGLPPSPGYPLTTSCFATSNWVPMSQ